VRVVCAAGVLLSATPARAGAAGAPVAGLLRCVQDRYGGCDLEATFAGGRVASLGRSARAGQLFQAQAHRWNRRTEPSRSSRTANSSGSPPDRRQVVVHGRGLHAANRSCSLGRGDFAAEARGMSAASPGAAGVVSLRCDPVEVGPLALVLEIVGGECRLAGTIVEDAFGNVTHLVFSGERTSTGLGGRVVPFRSCGSGQKLCGPYRRVCSHRRHRR
jgi:hypothetical protein